MDAESLAAWLPDEVPGLLRYARTLVRDADTAQDLVQSTLERALEQADGFRGESSTATWLHRILHNLTVDRARRRREVPHDDLLDAVDAVERRWRDDAWTVDPEAVLLRAEQRDELLEALTHLPFALRSAVLLHDATGLTVPEVAEVQQVGLSAAKQRVRRGRMMLVAGLAEGRERDVRTEGPPLRCWQAREHISDYVDGDLDAPTATRVEQHLRRCPTCPPLYAALVGVTEALRGPDRDPDSVVPPAVVDRLRAPGTS